MFSCVSSPRDHFLTLIVVVLVLALLSELWLQCTSSFGAARRSKLENGLEKFLTTSSAYVCHRDQKKTSTVFDVFAGSDNTSLVQNPPHGQETMSAHVWSLMRGRIVGDVLREAVASKASNGFCCSSKLRYMKGDMEFYPLLVGQKLCRTGNTRRHKPPLFHVSKPANTSCHVVRLPRQSPNLRSDSLTKRDSAFNPLLKRP